MSGRRRSSSRAQSHRREPDGVGVPARRQADVHVQPAVAGRLEEPDDPELVQQRLELLGGHRAWSKPVPGCGSRSMRSSSACSGSSARCGQTWKPRHARLTAHATCATSAATSARDVVPLTVLTVVVSSQSGALAGHALLEERRAARPVAGSAASAPAGRPSCA